MHLVFNMGDHRVESNHIKACVHVYMYIERDRETHILSYARICRDILPEFDQKVNPALNP